MRYFLLKDSEGIKSLVFHDYLSEEYFCQTNSLSFKKIFNNQCTKVRFKFIKKDNKLLRARFGPGDFNWMDNILEKICVGVWKVLEIGELRDREGVDSLIFDKLV
jgi:hypothetical protein